MSLNTNGTIDIPKTIRELWPSIGGMLFVWVLEVVLSLWLYQTLKIDAILWLGVWAGLLLLTTFLIWTVQTKRWFQRTGYWILLHYFGTLLIVYTVYLAYPLLIEGSKLDFPYIRYWLPVAIGAILITCSYLYVCRKHDGLCIVFLVRNQSQYERDILQALVEAQSRVEQVANNIQIVIPPFGIANTPKGCERYINSHFNQADAVIFASLIDSPQGSEFGYSFNRFTSMMSDRYIKKGNRDEESIRVLMDESYRCHEWNTLNINTDQISRHLEVAGNLTHLFLMYVSCIYLQKNKYTEAIDVSEALYTYASTGNARYDDLVRELVVHSYVTAQYIEEYDNQDYIRAHEILDECVRRIPQMKRSLSYELSMARIFFYEGNVRESKRVTRSIKTSRPTAEWYVTTNMAFFAIYEKKPGEMVSHYKKMLKMQKQDRREVDYAIRFLKIEMSKTNDLAYLMGLCHGIAFLSLYIDEAQSDKYYKKTRDYVSIVGYRKLEPMRQLIVSSKGKLGVKKK